MRDVLRAGVVAAALAATMPAAADAALTPSIDAGIDERPRVGWVPPADVACTHWVRKGGSNSGPGTQAQPWATPDEALRRLNDGGVACVGAGEYPMPADTSPANGGTAAAPIVLQGAPGETKPTLVATGEGEMFDFEAGDNHWVLRDLTIDKRKHKGFSVRVIGANNIALRNVDARNGGEDAFQVAGGSSDVDIEGGVVADNYETDSSGNRKDAHALIVEGRNIFRVAMRGVEAYGNSGDGIQCSALDDTQPYRADQPADILIEENRFHDNAENAVDIKSCQRVSIRGAVNPERPVRAANQKFHGFVPTTNTGTNTSNGTAIVLHFAARGVLIENTRIWNACEGIAIGRGNDYVRDVVIRRVLMFGMKGEADHGERCKGYGLRVGQAQNVEAYHNSIDETARAALDLTGSYGFTSTSSGVRVWNNIFSGRGNRAVDLEPERFPGLEMDNNLFHAAGRPAQPLERDDAALDLAGWQDASNDTLDMASRVGHPDWITDRLTVDFYTRAGSPARDIGRPVPGGFHCDAAPDAGFRESGCSS